MSAPLSRAFLAGVAACAAAVVVGLPAATGATDQPRVLVASFDNDVNPVTREYLVEAMQRAERDGFAALVIEMDTPGGLGSSMRDIVKAMLATTVPVIVYVAPGGSSADSAGAVIGQAADVLAMAPQTKHRLIDADHDERARFLEGPAAKGRERRRRVRRRARPRARTEREGGRGDGANRSELRRP